MRIAKTTLAGIMCRLFSIEHQNTAQIARKLKTPEHEVDHVISRRLAEEWNRGRTP